MRAAKGTATHRAGPFLKAIHTRIQVMRQRSLTELTLFWKSPDAMGAFIRAYEIQVRGGDWKDFTSRPTTVVDAKLVRQNAENWTTVREKTVNTHFAAERRKHLHSLKAAETRLGGKRLAKAKERISAALNFMGQRIEAEVQKQAKVDAEFGFGGAMEVEEQEETEEEKARKKKFGFKIDPKANPNAREVVHSLRVGPNHISTSLHHATHLRPFTKSRTLTHTHTADVGWYGGCSWGVMYIYFWGPATRHLVPVSCPCPQSRGLGEMESSIIHYCHRHRCTEATRATLSDQGH